MPGQISQRLKAILDWARGKPYLGVLARAAERSVTQHDKDMAASIAYFTFLSLFPLFLGLVSLGGFVLKSGDMQLRVNALIVEVLPVSADFVMSITDSLVEIRGATGVTSALVLIWSASKMVAALSRTINRALSQTRNFAIYLSPIRNFALTLIVATLIIMALAVSPLLEVLSDLQLEIIGRRGNQFIENIAGRTSGIVTTVMAIGLLYALVPHHRLSFSAILPGLLTASVLIEVGKSAFVWYVGTVSNYNTVYGSMSSIIVLLIWLYFSARVVVYGAEVISVNETGT